MLEVVQDLKRFEVPLTEDGEEMEMSVETIEKLEHELLVSSEVFFGLVIGLQVALYQLQKRYPAAFNNTALFCLWIYPVISFYFNFQSSIEWCYIGLWLTWSAKTILIVRKGMDINHTYLRLS